MDGIIFGDIDRIPEIRVSDVLSRKWSIDFTSRCGRFLLINCRSRSTPPPQVSTSDLHPPGYIDRSFPGGAIRDSDPQLVIQRSWNIALGPLRQVPMNLFIMWISGNSISFFPLMSVIMLFLRPIQALFSIHTSKINFIGSYCMSVLLLNFECILAMIQHSSVCETIAPSLIPSDFGC